MKGLAERGRVKLIAPLRTECCTNILPSGMTVTIFQHYSPKRIVIGGEGENGYHKVRVSRLRTASGKKLEYLSEPEYAEGWHW